MKKLILLSGSPCVGKTTVGQYLLEQYNNSAYLDGDWCWLHLPPYPTDIVIHTDNKSVTEIAQEMKKYIDKR